MWHDLWPGLDEADVPIQAITNGVHPPPGWQARCHALADQHGSDGALWQARNALRGRMVQGVRRRDAQRRERLGQEARSAAPTQLSPAALTIGFARRFATYKRATLLFKDPERLKAILNDRRPAGAARLRRQGPPGR